MPTLNATDNPPCLAVRGEPWPRLPRVRHNHLWHVGCVRSRQEKKFAFSLLDLGVSYYLPLQAYTANSANHQIIAQRLLFPGYIFFYTTPTRRSNIPPQIRAPMYSYIEVPKSAEKRLRQQLTSLLVTAQAEQAKLYSPSPLDLSKFTPGQHIRFIEGPLCDTQAQILHRRNQPSTSSILLELKVELLGAAMFEVQLTPQDRYVQVVPPPKS